MNPHIFTNTAASATPAIQQETCWGTHERIKHKFDVFKNQKPY